MCLNAVLHKNFLFAKNAKCEQSSITRYNEKKIYFWNLILYLLCEHAKHVAFKFWRFNVSFLFRFVVIFAKLDNLWYISMCLVSKIPEFPKIHIKSNQNSILNHQNLIASSLMYAHYKKIIFLKKYFFFTVFRKSSYIQCLRFFQVSNFSLRTYFKPNQRLRTNAQWASTFWLHV